MLNLKRVETCSVWKKSSPLRSEAWLPRSPPPAASSWRGQTGKWWLCWSCRLRCQRPDSSGSLERRTWWSHVACVWSNVQDVEVWAPLTSGVPRFGRRSQEIFKDVVEEELQPGIRKHGHEGRRQAAVKRQNSLWAKHRGHGVSHVPVHLTRQSRYHSSRKQIRGLTS